MAAFRFLHLNLTILNPATMTALMRTSSIVVFGATKFVRLPHRTERPTCHCGRFGNVVHATFILLISETGKVKHRVGRLACWG